MELEMGNFGRHIYPRRKWLCRFVMDQSNERWPAGCWGELVTAWDVKLFGNVVMSNIGVLDNGCTIQYHIQPLS